MNNTIIVPSHEADFTPLSRTKQGRLFKKHILSKGELIHPVTGQSIKIDDGFVERLKDNFSSGVCDIVQVPLANQKNEHTEDPLANIGEVVDVQEENGKIYAVVDARDQNAADKLGKTLLGASAMLHLNYTDTRTGKKVGPTLLHVCVTNRPYVTGLEDYQEILAATADSSGEAVLFTQVEKESAMPTKEELIAALRDEHGVDVSALQTRAAQADQTSALLSQLQDNGSLSLSQSDSGITTDDLVGAVAELANTNTSLNSRVETLEATHAETEVQKLVDEGKILPANKDVMVELRLTQPDVYERLVPDQPIIALNAETGLTPPEDEGHKKTLEDEIARLTQQQGQFFGVKS